MHHLYFYNIIILTIFFIFNNCIFFINCITIKDDTVIEKWITVSTVLDDIFFPSKKEFINLINNAIKQVNISSKCYKSWNIIENGLNQRKTWALKFFESSAGKKSGLLRGYISDLGDRDECLEISISLGKDNLKGSYCWLTLELPVPSKVNYHKYSPLSLDLKHTSLEDSYFETISEQVKFFYNNSLSIGFCAPFDCDYSDIKKVLNKVFENTHVNPVLKSCENNSESKNSYSLPGQLSLLFLVLYVLFVLLCTIVTHYKPQVFVCISAFSLIKNHTLLTSNFNESERMQFISFIRSSFRIMGLFGHIFLSLGLVPHLFPVFSYKVPNPHWFLHQVFKQCFIAIEIYFFISGFFTAYSWYPRIEKEKGNLSFIRFVLNRYLRSAPLMISILLLLNIFSIIGKGPVFVDLQRHFVGNCHKYWWSNILFISNWVRPYEMCYPFSWTTSVDFQLYTLSFFPLILLTKKFWIGLITIIFMIIFSCLIIFIKTFYHRIPLLYCCTMDYDLEDLYSEHFNTLPHIGPYLLGIVIGYCVVSKKRMDNKIMRYLGHIIACFCFWLTYAGYYYSDPLNPSTIPEMLYISVQKILFTICYAWMFYIFSLTKSTKPKSQKTFTSKSQSYAGIIVVHSRLSYSIAMSEMLFVLYDVTHSYIPLNPYNIAMRFIYTIVMCTFFGYVVHLLFEAPSLHLTKYLLHKESIITSNNENKDDEKLE